MSVFDYTRRRTSGVKVGNIGIGGENPIRIQSMASTKTMDTEGSVAQGKRIIEAGAELLRYTAQGQREAANLGEIRRGLRELGLETPLVADIHFNPKAAFEAARRVEKVRINPGNFVDPARTFRKIEYTDEDYAAELRRIDDVLVPFLNLCKENGTAIRIGVNHGSLSDRIMSRYGDTPAGMVESAMEFLRVCRREDFNDVVISIKASNVLIMVETVRRLVAAMDAEGMHYPLHLGVTEAGDGEDGRIKSAVGIGTLLLEGIGDTIRVSLSEDPERELPVARKLVDFVGSMAGISTGNASPAEGYDSVRPVKRESSAKTAIVVGRSSESDYDETSRPDMFLDTDRFVELSADEVIAGGVPQLEDSDVVLLTADSKNQSARLLGALHQFVGRKNIVIPRLSYGDKPEEDVILEASAEAGRLLLAGFCDGLMIEADRVSDRRLAALSFAILQAARLRFTRTEYISCPGCGRTMFDLQQTLARVKEATEGLKGLKIGVMGCIVNGPGEMADADYGYVGAAVGHVNLYKGKTLIEKNIPQEEAVQRLIQLIKENGDWK